MGQIRWRRYRYLTGDPETTVFDLSRERKPLFPSTDPRVWHEPPWRNFELEPVASEAAALTWLRHHMTEAANELRSHRQRVPDIEAAVAAAARALNDRDHGFAYDWRVWLPGGAGLVIAVHTRYDDHTPGPRIIVPRPAGGQPSGPAGVAADRAPIGARHFRN